MTGFGQTVFLNNYTPAADIAVISVCYVMVILMVFSYIRKTISYRIFQMIVPTLIFTAAIDICFNVASVKAGLTLPVYVLHWLYHVGLFLIFNLFVLYIVEVAGLTGGRKKLVCLYAGILMIVCVLTDAAVSFLGPESVRESGDAIRQSGVVFIVGYVVSSAVCITLMRLVQRRLYRRVMLGFYSATFLSFLIIVIQYLVSQISFTCLSFLFPVIAMFYILHANPYDADMGTIDGTMLNEVVQYFHSKKKPFIFFSLFLPSVDLERAEFPDSVRSLIRQVSSKYFRGSVMFHVGHGHMIMLFPKQRNADYEHRMSKVISVIEDQHRIYRYDYKIVAGQSMDELSRRNEYLPLIHAIHRSMKDNAVHFVSPADLKSHDRSIYILQQLEDIHKTQNLDDPRVMVYCQPVFNLKENRYDTAEALMRLMLDETGMVFPDQFIYLAEENGYIHTLTEIILHKTCEEIRRLNATGYEITRVSVNVSMMELKDEHFCEDISGIIARSGLSGDKVAIELTESQSESDFNVMKAKIQELKEKGITFYLDDFGTGYSNMERIMELPFDIIKFDRSMVVSSSASERSEKIVSDLASLFNSLDYSVLYEGIETETDESMCRDMSASYLQGYKYSRPIPIADLKNWLPKKAG